MRAYQKTGGWVAVPEGYTAKPDEILVAKPYPANGIYDELLGAIREKTAAELLDERKAERKEEIRAKAQKIILAKWPLWKQNNCAMGVYPAAVATQCSDDIANVVEASNISEAAIDAATTEAELEAVSASWPVI